MAKHTISVTTDNIPDLVKNVIGALNPEVPDGPPIAGPVQPGFSMGADGSQVHAPTALPKPEKDVAPPPMKDVAPSEPSIPTPIADAINISAPPQHPQDTSLAPPSSLWGAAKEYLGFAPKTPAPGEMQKPLTGADKLAAIGNIAKVVGGSMVAAGGTPQQQQMLNQQLMEDKKLAADAPYRRAQIDHTNAQTKMMTEMVPVSYRDENGNPVQTYIPRNQVGSVTGKIVTANTSERNTNSRISSSEKLAKDRLNGMYAEKGMKPNPAYNPANPSAAPEYIQMSPEEMSPVLRSKLAMDQSAMALKAAQQKLAEARANPNSPMFQLQLARVKTAQANYDLNRQRFERDTYGMVNGQVVPGGFTDGQGTPMGWRAPSNPTANIKTQGQMAEELKDHVGDILTQIEDLGQKGKLGPVQGRYNEFLAGKVGEGDPDYVRLRTNLGLFQTALMKAHVGSRGSEMMMHHFENLINAGKFDEASLMASMGEINKYLTTYANYGHKQVQGGTPTSSPNPNPRPQTPNANGSGGHPQTHVFSKSAWLRANPKGNINEAVAAANAAGYQVTE